MIGFFPKTLFIERNDSSEKKKISSKLFPVFFKGKSSLIVHCLEVDGVREEREQTCTEYRELKKLSEFAWSHETTFEFKTRCMFS